MNWYFITLFVIYILYIGINLAKHNEVNILKYNFWDAIVESLLVLWLIIEAIKTGF